MKIARCLKIIAAPSQSKRKRTVRSYESNLSMARMRESGHDLCKLQTINEALRCAVTRDLIQDHAYRRVQLFYSTAVVYYDEKCRLGIDKTITQIGRSTCSFCNSAHHALHPRLWDNSNQTLQKAYRNDPTDEALLRKLEALGFDLEQLKMHTTKRATKRIFDAFLFDNRDRLIKPRSFFQFALDSTIPIRAEVNEYDCVIEEYMRPLNEKLLQSVSDGKIEPFEATVQFVENMKGFFDKSAAATKQTIQLLKRLGETPVSTVEYQELRRAIKAQQFVRKVKKRENPIDLLFADLEIIAQQRAATVVPPKEHLRLGLSYFEQKLLLLKG